MSFTLPPLPYSPNALEPYFDARTMEIHHGKHHQTYIDKLNAALDGNEEFSNLPILELISDLSRLPTNLKAAVRNNGGGHANHSFFWESLSPNAGGSPKGELSSALDQTFGSFEGFKDAFSQSALTRFGSGWAWLVRKTDGTLAITSTPNQDSPWMNDVSEINGTPLIGLDVWEHAYYLNYQNRRPDYVSAFWNVVDWTKASQLFAS
jgi:superoxide dismutase, Fe-Mn family